MRDKLGKRAIALIVVSLVVATSLMAMPSSVNGKNGLPDLKIRNIGWRFPVIEGQELHGTVYIQNVGTVPVQTGFWLTLNYAQTPGFWQSISETQQLWIEPPIGAGEIKGVGFSTTALNTAQVNFEAIADSTNVIDEMSENNNVGHMCGISVGAAPGSVVSVPLYLKNSNLNSAESFTIGVNASTIPDGWEVSGGLPPTTIDAPPGGSAVVVETIHVPTDTLLNPILEFNSTKASDGDSRHVFIKVLSTPEVGFSYDPYTDNFFVTGVDDINSDCTVSSEIVSVTGSETLIEYTLTATTGLYVSALVEMKSTEHENKFSILSLDFNGDLQTTPDKNEFKTTFEFKDGVLRHYEQEMKYSIGNKSSIHYDVKSQETTIKSTFNGEKSTLVLEGWQGLGVRVENGNVIPIRLDTSNTMVPCICPNVLCTMIGWCGIKDL